MASLSLSATVSVSFVASPTQIYISAHVCVSIPVFVARSDRDVGIWRSFFIYFVVQVYFETKLHECKSKKKNVYFFIDDGMQLDLYRQERTILALFPIFQIRNRILVVR